MDRSRLFIHTGPRTFQVCTKGRTCGVQLLAGSVGLLIPLVVGTIHPVEESP